MRRIVLSMLLVVSLAGFARAQDEMTGEAAEKAKKEIIELEDAKVKILLSGKSATPDWYERILMFLSNWMRGGHLGKNLKRFGGGQFTTSLGLHPGGSHMMGQSGCH